MTMPWEQSGDGLDIPPALKRDKNNRAPFMDDAYDARGLLTREGWDKYQNGAVSPSANLPTFDPATLPPWVSKF